jgi:hypothetical protein
MKLWSLVFVLALTGCAIALPASAPAFPGMVRISEWGGTRSNTESGQRQRIERITVHHSGAAFDSARSTDEYLRDLQRWSRQEKGWGDLPYHFLIDRSGRTYEGRDLALAGDTNTGYSTAGHALVAVLGNFDEEEPTAAQLQALVDLMAWLVNSYEIPLERIAGHSNFSSITVCPGKHLNDLLSNGWLKKAVAEKARQSAKN